MAESCSSNTPLPIWLKIAEEMNDTTLKEELENLFLFYKEFMSEKIKVDLSTQWEGSRNNGEQLVAYMIQESNLPLSQLVQVTCDRLNLEVAKGNIVLAEPVTNDFVRSTILHVGDRLSYGLPLHADADRWEDITDSYLWCWETTWVSWDIFDCLPKLIVNQFRDRFYCRKSIVDRIEKISEMLEAIQGFKEASLHFMQSEDVFKIRSRWGDLALGLETAKLKGKRIRQILH